MYERGSPGINTVLCRPRQIFPQDPYPLITTHHLTFFALPTHPQTLPSEFTKYVGYFTNSFTCPKPAEAGNSPLPRAAPEAQDPNRPNDTRDRFSRLPFFYIR